MRRAFLLFCLLLPLAMALSPATAQDRRQPRGDMWERLKVYDLNGDGKVTREEFGGPIRLWEMLDQNRDGVIRKDEVDKVAAAQGNRRRRAPNYDWIFKKLDRDDDDLVDLADLKAVLEKADTDGDGKLSKAEWKAFLAENSKHMSSGKPPEVGQAAPDFKLHPLQGDGPVTLETLLAKGKPVVLLFGSFT